MFFSKNKSMYYLLKVIVKKIKKKKRSDELLVTGKKELKWLYYHNRSNYASRAVHNFLICVACGPRSESSS